MNGDTDFGIMGASTATLTESLDCLRERWTDVVDVLSGKYAVWLGSGISRECFPDLGALLRLLLDRLHSQIQAGDAACPYRRCLENVIQLTTIHPCNLVEEPPENWTNNVGELVVTEIIAQLWERYPDALDQTVRVNGHTLTATFDLLKLHEMYGDSSKLPDAEHRFLALLIAEGILDELVTTNWDALIEAAHAACRAAADRQLDVIAASEDIDGTGVAGRSRLTKIHGCARKTLADPHRYQPYMLATRTDITAWVKKPEFAPFRDMVHQLLRERPALFVGLSGQDWNLQAECFATFMTVGPIPNDRPRVIFSMPALQHPQKTFLKALYGADHYAAHEDRLVKDAALSLYGKPLLGTLYLLTLLLKARKLAERGFGKTEQVWCGFVKQSVKQWQAFLQQRYDAAADPSDPHRAWRQLAEELPRVVTRFVTMYRDLTVLASPTAYHALDDRHLGMLATAPNVPELNYHWLLLVLAVLKEGWVRRQWELDLPLGVEAQHGQFVLRLSGRVLTVFVVRDGASSLPQMIRERIVDMTNASEIVVIYPSDREPAHLVSPSQALSSTRGGVSTNRFPNRTRSVGPAEIWMRDRVDVNDSPTKLLQALRMEMQSA
ncbi:MAG: SIR2 family protein [Planctomycetales bacterium]|nr:SIR2 family protein [Planctomycetales bacterium]